MRKYLQRLINKLAFNNQRHPHDHKLVEAFVDSNGVKYFKYKDRFNMPVVRLGALQDFLFQLSRKIDKGEMELFIKAMNMLITNAVASLTHADKAVKHLARLQTTLDDMELREKEILHPELMFDVVAVNFIREDENPAQYDEVVHAEKVEQFKKDSAGGLYDFFYSSSTMEYFPGLELLREDYQELWDYSKTKQSARIEALYQIASQQNYGADS